MMEQITPLKGNVCPQLFSIFFLLLIFAPDIVYSLRTGKGHFFLQFNVRGFFPANESESATSLWYFTLKAWTGSWCGGGGEIGKLEEPVLRFCLFILRSQQGSCVVNPLPLTVLGGWCRNYYFFLISHWSFIQCTAKNHISLFASPVVV